MSKTSGDIQTSELRSQDLAVSSWKSQIFDSESQKNLISPRLKNQPAHKK